MSGDSVNRLTVYPTSRDRAVSLYSRAVLTFVASALAGFGHIWNRSRQPVAVRHPARGIPDRAISLHGTATDADAIDQTMTDLIGVRWLLLPRHG